MARASYVRSARAMAHILTNWPGFAPPPWPTFAPPLTDGKEEPVDRQVQFRGQCLRPRHLRCAVQTTRLVYQLGGRSGNGTGAGCGGVNDILMAISGSLPLEQVLAPNFMTRVHA